MGDYILRKMSVFYPKISVFFCYDKHHRTKRGKRDEPIQHISRRRRPGNRKISRQTIRTGRLQGKKSLQRHGGTRHPHDRTDPSDPARCHDAQNERSFRPDENKRKNNIPIIMLSTKTEESDKVIGLSMGADDTWQSRIIPPNSWPVSNPSSAVTSP